MGLYVTRPGTKNRQNLDKRTLNYVYDEVAVLIKQNWDTFHNNCEYAKAKDMAYRDMIRILTDILNK